MLWPEQRSEGRSEGWPKLGKVAEFQDEAGVSQRYLTRTDEPIILGHPRRKNSAMQAQ